MRTEVPELANAEREIGAAAAQAWLRALRAMAPIGAADTLSADRDRSRELDAYHNNVIIGNAEGISTRSSGVYRNERHLEWQRSNREGQGD
jgi:hypothetical protein